MHELVESGVAAPGEIVLLFAAGTDAERYERALRELDLPTYRATGRGYFGQQQVVDLLAYLQLIRNRYDDVALATVLTSPFVGASNDALVLVRRHAGRRPLYTGIEKSLPEALADDDERLIRAFKQRFERLVAASARLSLERICEEIVGAHDYDLAVLARWDGKRRYANLRKLMRLARSYEELRGPDIEGFVRFIRDQEAVGAAQLEAVSEEEGADAVRLLTIHAAKGLEFKVVIVADAGRDTGRPPSSDEILALSDGRFGFRVVHPTSGKREPVFKWEEVREAERLAEDAERLRLYYVAMTRAVDRLIVSGAIDPERPHDRETPIGWVLGRLAAQAEVEEAAEPVELARGDARFLLRVDRGERRARRGRRADGWTTRRWTKRPRQAASSSCSPRCPPRPTPEPRGYRLPELFLPEPAAAAPGAAAVVLGARAARALLVPLLRRARRRPAGGAAGRLRARRGWRRRRSATRCTGCSSSSTCATRLRPRSAQVLEWYPTANADEIARIGGFVDAYCDSALARRLAGLENVRVERPFAFEHDGVLLHGRLDVLWREGGKALVLDYKTNSLAEHEPDEIIEDDYRLQRLVYALACFRAGADEVEVVYAFLERADAVVSTTFMRDEIEGLEAELSAAIARIDSGEFVPTPSEFTCSGCPARDLVCAGPRLQMPPAAVRRGRGRLGGRRGASSARRGSGSGRRRLASARSSSAWPCGTPTRRSRSRFASPLELLVSVMLSAQTTDVNVNRVTPALFAKYRRPEDYLAVPVAELERDIFATGFYRQKAKSLRGTMRLLDRRVRRRGARAVRGSAPPARRRAEDGERRVVRARQPAGDRRRHARPPPLAAAGPDEAGGPGEDRARSGQARPAKRLGAVSASPDLARPADLRRQAPALRGVPAGRGSLPVDARLTGPTASARAGCEATAVPGTQPARADVLAGANCRCLAPQFGVLERTQVAAVRRTARALRSASQRFGVRAISRPPSSSYAGKTSAMTGFSWPERVRIDSCSPSRRTPHSRASSTGFGSEKLSASTRSRPISSPSGKPVSSNTPRPIASTRRS